VAGLDVRSVGAAVLIGVRVRPRSRPALELTDGGLVLRVAAVPEKGKATEEARRALAQALGIPPSAVSLRSGPRARRKVFAVEGLDAVTARARLLESAPPRSDPPDG
jgi:uncharacterized protein YggU (UPF0235/DUF167 family)